jgi:glycine hydroxymethyltransferase
VTTRGFKEKDCEQVANWICDIFDDINNVDIQSSVRDKVLALCKQYPVYAK